MTDRGQGARRLVALVLGVAVPAVLLGAGWLWASVRERDGLAREERARLARTAAAIRGAFDEGLEELRRREDARPFYLYNHFYSPPDVVAVNDPVAVTPLAHDPEDPRVVGYFQIDPDGSVRTPYAADPSDPPTERARRVLAFLETPAALALRDLTVPAGADTMLAGLTPPEPRAAPAAEERAAPPTRPGRRSPPPARLEEPATPEPASEEALAQNPYAPAGPLTVSLNSWGIDVWNDLQAAQSGSPEANLRVQARGRQAPVTLRQELGWDEAVERSNAAQASHRATAPPQQTSPRSGGAARREAAAAQEASPAPVSPSLGNLRRRAAEVEYTPMDYRPVGDGLVLHRVVSHEGAAVVQGLLLDREELVARWLPALLDRHAHGELTPEVRVGGDDAGCAASEPASAVLPGVALCFPAAALGVATGAMDDALHLQVAALLALLCVVVLAGGLVHRAATRAEELGRQKTAFVSAVSHELRTPLTTIRMHSEMLAEGMVGEARRPRVYAELVREGVRLGRLVDNVLEVSRIEAGKRPLRREEGDLAAHVAAVAEAQRAHLEHRGLALGVTSPEEPVVASFDAQAVEQILVNLLDNAAKYATGSDPAEVEVAVALTGEGATLSVRDHGPGIPEAERERVFERFHRVERAETAHAPGTGIGLSLVRDLARAHGGDARAEPAAGGGLRVVVTLPASAGSGGLAL